MDKTQEQKKIDFESNLQANTGKTSDSFRSVPTPQGINTVNVADIERNTKVRLPESPNSNIANSFISGVNIPQEQVPQDKNENQVIPEEKVNTLRQDIQDKSQILNELGLSDITTTFNELLGKGAFTQNLEDKAGIDQKTTDLNDIESQLRETDLKFRREREALQDQAGLTKAQKNARLSNISRDQARELADLSIIAATRRDDLTTAQALVDRKVELAFEPIEQKLQFQQFLFNENKELFTAAEKRQFDIKMRDEQVQIDKDKFKFQQFEQLKAEYQFNASAAGQGNAYLQQIAAAESNEDLLGIPGIQNYTLSKADKLGIRLQEAQLSETYANIAAKTAEAKAELESEDEEVREAAIAKKNAAKESFDLVAGMINNSVGLSNSVGNLGIGRVKNPFFLGDSNRFIANAKTLTSKETLQNLIDIKAQGATFGALSDGERQEVSRAANKLSGFAIYDNQGNTTGQFKGSEKDIAEALDSIQYNAAKSYLRSGGIQTPEMKPYAKRMADEYIEELNSILITNEYESAGY